MSTASGRARAARLKSRRTFWQRVRTVALVLVVIPLVLVPVYSIVPPISTLMIYSRLFGPVKRNWVSLDEMSPVLVAAVLMSEDGKFCSHRGIDWGEVGKVLDDTDGKPRGASTIPMQTVKNLFLWTSRSYIRKVVEVPLALYADLIWSKRRTMEIYLNVVEWGPNVFGAEAAARYYFKRPARQLTVGQAALLAVTLPNPDRRNPARPTASLQALAAVAAARAEQSGDYIGCLHPQRAKRLVKPGLILYKAPLKPHSEGIAMAVPKRKTSRMKRGFRRSADALKPSAYVEDKDSGELRRPHHIDLKSGMYRGRQVLEPKSEA